MPTDILIVISGANLVALLGLLGKVWTWSNGLEKRLSVLETQVSFLVKVEAQRMYGMEFRTPEEG